MANHVGWYLDKQKFIIRPVAKIVEDGPLMKVCWYVRNSIGKLMLGKAESIAVEDFFGAPVFIFEAVGPCNAWYVDAQEMTIRPVAQFRGARGAVQVRWKVGREVADDSFCAVDEAGLVDSRHELIRQVQELIEGVI